MAMGLIAVCSGCCTFYAFSNAILGIIGTILLPLYFSFCGPETAIRFSLLLCVHALILACLPKAIKSLIPMVQLVLLGALLFVPINVTPFVAVWVYEKLLFLADPVVSIIEALQVVLFVTHISQSLVDEIEVNPTFVKSTIVSIAFTSYSCVLWISYNLFVDEVTSVLEKWVLFIVLVASVSVLIICLIQDEGIISDAAVVSLMMVCILWAMKQERIMSTNPLKVPSKWTESLGGKSFLWALNSMASSSLSHLGQAQVILRNLVSPTYLMLAAIRVCSVVLCLWLIRNLQPQDEDEDNEDNYSLTANIPKFSTLKLNSLLVRLIFIFVYTEFLLRSMQISTHHSLHYKSSFLPSLPDWIRLLLFEVLYEVRVWRVIQLCVTVMTYVYVLLNPRDT